MALSNFFSMKLQSVDLDQMLLETDKQQDQKKEVF